MVNHVVEVEWEGPRTIKLTSGVEVEALPMPGGAWERLQARAMELFPDPEPKMKEIDTSFGEKEEVGDLEDPVYLAGKRRAESQRSEWTGKVVLRRYVKVDLEQYAEIIKELDEDFGLSAEPEQRKLDFLTWYAIQTPADTSTLMVHTVYGSLLGDEEVAKRLEFFRRSLARGSGDEPDAHGADEEDGVDLQEEVA